MIQSIYTARLGVIAQQKRVDTIANNIANINTFGFRSSTINFKDALYSAMQNPVAQNLNLQQGTGVLVASSNHSFKEGTPTITGVKLDFCLEGDGFFTVLDSKGTLKYTRNGCFAVSSEADGNYLVNDRGYYAMDTQGSRIKLPQDISDLAANSKGELSIGAEAPFAALNLASFKNNEGLEAIEGSCFIPTAASGPASAAQNATVKQGFLESSNVDLSLEMTRLIRAQRAFTLAGKAITTADEMDSLANNMRT